MVEAQTALGLQRKPGNPLVRHGGPRDSLMETQGIIWASCLAGQADSWPASRPRVASVAECTNTCGCPIGGMSAAVTCLGFANALAPSQPASQAWPRSRHREPLGFHGRPAQRAEQTALKATQWFTCWRAQLEGNA